MFATETMAELSEMGIRSYIAEPDRGRRDWSNEPGAQAPVYRNRRRMRGPRGRRLMRQRGERIERSFAHLYDTGGMRRTHLRGHQNILKRLLIHAGGFNLGLLIRSILGVGTPRGLQSRLAAVLAAVAALIAVARHQFTEIRAVRRVIAATSGWVRVPLVVNSSAAATCTTGC
jgi:transposase